MFASSEADPSLRPRAGRREAHLAQTRPWNQSSKNTFHHKKIWFSFGFVVASCLALSRDVFRRWAKKICLIANVVVRNSLMPFYWKERVISCGRNKYVFSGHTYLLSSNISELEGLISFSHYRQISPFMWLTHILTQSWFFFSVLHYLWLFIISSIWQVHALPLDHIISFLVSNILLVSSSLFHCISLLLLKYFPLLDTSCTTFN